MMRKPVWWPSYENGKKIHCERHVRLCGGDLVGDIKLEGQSWAMGLGFKPGEEGWKGFTMDDADDLVQHLGFNPTPAEPTEWIVFSETPIKP